MKSKRLKAMPVVPPQDGEIERDNAHYRLNPSGHRELVIKKRGGDEETLNELAAEIYNLLEYMDMGEASNDAISAEQPQLERNVHTRANKTFTPQYSGSPQDKSLTHGETISNLTGSTKRAEDVSNVRSLKDEDSDKYILSGDAKMESFTGTAGIAISPVAYQTYDDDEEDGDDESDNSPINEVGLKMTKKYIVEWEPEFVAGDYHPGDAKMKKPSGNGLADKHPTQEKLGHYDTEMIDGGEPFGAEHNETAAMCDVEESGVEDKPQGVHKSTVGKPTDGHTKELGHNWPNQPKHKGGGVAEPVSGNRYSDGGVLGANSQMEWSPEKIGNLLGEDVNLQRLFDSYARNQEQIDLNGFLALCEAHGVDAVLDESSLMTLMHNNREYVFHEYRDNNGSFWIGESARTLKKNLNEHFFYGDGENSEPTDTSDDNIGDIGEATGGEVIHQAGDTQLKRISSTADKMEIGREMNNCLSDPRFCKMYGDIYVIAKGGRMIAAATTDGSVVVGEGDRRISHDKFEQLAGTNIDWDNGPKMESGRRKGAVINEVQFRSPEEEAFYQDDDDMNYESMEAGSMSDSDELDAELGDDDSDFGDNYDRRYGGGSFGGEDTSRQCPGCGYDGLEETCPECGHMTMASEADIPDPFSDEPEYDAEEEFDLMDSLQKFMQTAKQLIETRKNPGAKLNEAWDSIVGTIESHRIPSAVGATLDKMQAAISGFEPAIAESGKHAMSHLGGSGLQAKGLKTSPDLEDQPDMEDMEEHGQKNVLGHKTKNTYTTTPIMKGTEKGLSGTGKVASEARWIGANANTLRENIDKLAKRVKNTLRESVDRLPKGKHSVSFDIVVKEGKKMNATPRRWSLAESLADLEEVLQFNNPNDVALSASFKNAAGTTIFTKKIPLATINKRGPIVQEGKMIFRFPKHARLVAECLGQSGAASTLVEHNWGSALKTKATITQANEAYGSAPNFKTKALLAETLVAEGVDADLFFGELAQDLKKKAYTLTEAGLLNTASRAAQGVMGRMFGQRQAPEDVKSRGGGYSNKDFSQGKVRQAYASQKAGFAQAMKAAQGFETALNTLGASKASIGKFMQMIYKVLKDFGQKRFGGSAAAPPSATAREKRYGAKPGTYGYQPKAAAPTAPAKPQDKEQILSTTESKKR